MTLGEWRIRHLYDETVICAGCGTVTAVPQAGIRRAVRLGQMSAEGWVKVCPLATASSHLCPSCVETVIETTKPWDDWLGFAVRHPKDEIAS